MDQDERLRQAIEHAKTDPRQMTVDDCIRQAEQDPLRPLTREQAIRRFVAQKLKGSNETHRSTPE